MLKRIWLDEAIEVSFQRTGDFARSARARAIVHALGPLSGKALHPFSARRIRQVAGRRDRVDVAACDNLTDGLRAAKDPGLFRLFQQGLSRRQSIIAKVTFEGAHHLAPEGFTASLSYEITAIRF